MIKARKLIFPLFIFTFFFAFRSGQIYAEENGATINSIEVNGLRRTRPHIARYPLERFLGREGETLDLNEVKAAVIDTRILDPVAVELIDREDGLILSVTVQEKWTIFPIPILFGNSDEISFGLYIADMNAFGLRDIAALGAVYSSSGWIAMASYLHTPNRPGLPGWNILFAYGHRERRNTDSAGILARRYSVNQIRFSLGFNYPFSEIFSVSASAFFTDISLRENANAVDPPEKGARLLGFSPAISLRSSSWDGYLLSRRGLSVNYGFNLGFSNFSYHQADLHGLWEQPIIPGFRLNFHSAATWRSKADPQRDPLFEEGPHRTRIVILPSTFSARNHAGFSAGLEKYLFRMRWGTLSALGSWQAIFSDSPIWGREFNHGPAAGIRFYLSRVALPAMDINVGYNMNTGLFQFAFGMGAGF